MSSLKTRVFAVKLMLLDHGEVVKCVNLDEELAKRGVDGPEALQDEIKRQAAILDEYEAKYGEVRSMYCKLRAWKLNAVAITRHLFRALRFTASCPTNVFVYPRYLFPAASIYVGHWTPQRPPLP